MLEGLSYGKLCIATNESGADDIVVDGINGILVNEKDVPALIGALIRADSLSDEIKLEMANAAIETSKQYDWHKVSSEYYRFLKEAALDEKILILNSDSPFNKGDQAILLGSIKLIKSVWPDSEITAISNFRERDEDWFGIKFINMAVYTINPIAIIRLALAARSYDIIFWGGESS